MQCVYTELVTTLAEVQPVSALTLLDGELYVVRSASHDIDVFDVKSFSLRRHLTVSSVQRTLLAVVSLGRASGSSITDITSCRRHHCLYVAERPGGVVRRLDRKNAKQVTQWSVGNASSVSLSVASTLNVVVTCCDSLSLRIYTPLGCPVCEINVQWSGVVGLLDGVQLDCGSFVVIGVTESGDRLACVYRHDAGMPDVIESSGCPTCIAVVGGRAGSRVWLAERGASAGVRSVQLPASSACSAKLTTTELEAPDKMCWDEHGKCLYIVDNGRVKVFRVHMKHDMC